MEIQRDILKTILTFIPTCELKYCSMVNKNWNRIVKDFLPKRIRNIVEEKLEFSLEEESVYERNQLLDIRGEIEYYQDYVVIYPPPNISIVEIVEEYNICNGAGVLSLYVV